MSSHAVTRWSPARRAVAALALAVAVGTISGGAALGGSGWPLYGSVAYVAVTALGLLRPAAIVLQVVGGQALVAQALWQPSGPSSLEVLPVVLGVVATAELLAIVARLDGPIPRDPRGDLARAGLAAVVGSAAFGVVVLLGGLIPVTGMVAALMGAGGCVLLALVLVGSTVRRGSIAVADDPPSLRSMS